MTDTYYEAYQPAPPLTLHGKAMAVGQFLEIRRRRHSTRWLTVSMGVLLTIMGFAAFGVAGLAGDAETMLILVMMLIAIVLGIVAGSRTAAAHRRADNDAWACYQAAVAGGLTTVFYPDRVEQFSSRWRATVPFDGKTRYTETAALMILEHGESMIVLRGEDLTPADAAAAQAHIFAGVPATAQYATGRLTATRTQPAPPPCTAPPVCYEQVTVPTPRTTPLDSWPTSAAPWVLAACLVCGGLLAALFAITNSFLLDCLIFFAACFGGAIVFMLMFWWLMGQKNTVAAPVTLSFTGEGLQIEQNGVQRFVAAIAVRARRTERGATLFTPAGNYTFSWTDVKNRQQLEWMLFGQRY